MIVYTLKPEHIHVHPAGCLVTVEHFSKLTTETESETVYATAGGNLHNNVHQ